MASQTSNLTHPRPMSTTRVTTDTRTPNYLYRVPRDEEINLPRSAAASGSTIRTSTSITASNASSNSVSYTAGNTVPRTPNSSMPSTASSVTPAEPCGSNTTSSYNSSALGNNASTLSRNENNPVNSNVSTAKPQEATVSGISTSSINSQLENLDLNNYSNSTMNATTSSGSIGSSQFPLNKRNGESKENLNSEHKKNAYRRQRNNNASGDSQARHRPQFNNQNNSGNRQPRDRNHRPRNGYPSNSEEIRGNNRNRPNDSRNRQHPRSRTPRNVFSDHSPTENNSGDDRTKQVHDAFMKKLVGTFSLNYDKFRGLFCAACNHYEVFIGRRPKVKHIDTQEHISNMREKPRIKSMSCSNCKIKLFCDVQFLVAHKQCEIHMFIADQKPRSAEGCTEPSKKVENGVEGASEQVENAVKGENTLNFKREIKEKFLQRLDQSSEINDYSFYCHLCEEWFTSHEVWDEHLKNQHPHDDDDRKIMNTTFKHCQQCKLMMCGSKLLKIFHTDAEEHEKFRTFLNIPSIENDADDDEEDDDHDTRDDVSTTSSAAARDQYSQKPAYLVLKNVPSTASKRDIFAYFKDFGRLENWEMNPIGENSAVVQFRFRNVAENLIKSKFPLEIHGSRIVACLKYL